MTGERREPAALELFLLAITAYLICVACVQLLAGYRSTLLRFGDTPYYVRICQAIRSWDFSGAGQVKLFWGLPYAAALVARLSFLPDPAAVVAVSVCSSIASVLLARSLWGGWVAGIFAVLNWDWIQRSVLGGSEPLFVALVLASFWALRRQRWSIAALLAALSVVVRPVGLLALAAICAVLLLQGQIRRSAASIAIGLVVGSLYTLPLLALPGHPLAGFHGYQVDWTGGTLIGLPFAAIARGFLRSQAGLANSLKILAWLLLVVAGAVALLAKTSSREYCRKHPAEALFAAMYLAFLLTYNSQKWAWPEFPRFAIPFVPFALAGLHDWLPKHRAVLWSLGFVSPALAAASALNVHHLLEQLRGLW